MSLHSLPPSSVPIVAAFDFDGTITTCDSLMQFFVYLYGWPHTYLKMAPLIPALMGFKLGMLSRQAIKERILTTFFEGVLLQDLQEKAQNYADRALDRLLRPQALQRLLWHQQQGHTCVLISASISLYLEPWAKRHGFSHVLCSQLQVEQGLITGKLTGFNCWGAEKVNRLLNALGPKSSFYLYAYGDSEGDQALLNLADQAFFRIF